MNVPSVPAAGSTVRVLIVITDRYGVLRGLVGGSDPIFAALIRRRIEVGEGALSKVNDATFPVGQDIYATTVPFLEGCRHAIGFLSNHQFNEMIRLMDPDCIPYIVLEWA